MEEWFFTKDGQQDGPVTPLQIQALAKAGQLDPATTHVWREGMADWKIWWMPCHRGQVLHLNIFQIFVAMQHLTPRQTPRHKKPEFFPGVQAKAVSRMNSG